MYCIDMTDKINPTQHPELSEHDAELLSAYIDNMLPASERHALEARLENDPFLRQELDAMRQTVAWVNALPTLKAPRDFTISAEDVAPVPRKVIPMPRQNWWFAASAAAIVVVLIGVVAILPNISKQAPASDATFEQVAIANTDSAEELETENLAFDTAEDGSEADVDESAPATDDMGAEAPPESDVARNTDADTQAQAPNDISSRSLTAMPEPTLTDTFGQGAGIEIYSTTADETQAEPQESVMMTVMTEDTDESADSAPNANIASASVVEESTYDAVVEAENSDMEELGMMDDTFAISPEEQSIEVILSILEAFRRFLEALHG